MPCSAILQLYHSVTVKEWQFEIFHKQLPVMIDTKISHGTYEISHQVKHLAASVTQPNCKETASVMTGIPKGWMAVSRRAMEFHTVLLKKIYVIYINKSTCKYKLYADQKKYIVKLNGEKIAMWLMLSLTHLLFWFESLMGILCDLPSWHLWHHRQQHVGSSTMTYSIPQWG